MGTGRQSQEGAAPDAGAGSEVAGAAQALSLVARAQPCGSGQCAAAQLPGAAAPPEVGDGCDRVQGQGRQALPLAGDGLV